MPAFVFRRPLALLAGVAALADGLSGAPPNVLLIMTEQQAADALSCRMGDTHLRTPAMDRLAAEGTFFTRADAANPLCMPSRVAMFSGRFPHETPHYIAEYTRGQPLSNGPVGEPPPLAELPPPPANLGAPAFEPDSMTLIRRGYHANRRLFPVGHFMPSTWQAMRWGYYRMIEKVDAEIGRVLAALRTSGQDRNTLIVFLSDHGECAGAHGLSQKTVFYEESIRVPLIIRPPAGSMPREADAFVNTGIDLLPTLLDYAGLPRPERLPGASLRPHADGHQVEAWRDHLVLGNHMSQGGLIEEEGFVPITEGRMVRTEYFKYCVYLHGERRESLIYLTADPGEMIDLAADPAYRSVLLEHRELLRGFGERRRDPLVAFRYGERPRRIPESGGPGGPRGHRGRLARGARRRTQSLTSGRSSP